MHDGLVCHKKNNCLSFLKFGIRNLRFVIRVLSFMFVPFWVNLDKVCLSGLLFCFGHLLLFTACILHDDESD